MEQANKRTEDCVMRIERLAALCLGGAMAAFAAGCGGIDKDAEVATFDGEAVPLGVANFAARLTQAGSDDTYVSYFGEEVWGQDLFGTGSTLEQQVKDEVMDSLYDMYVLEAHAEEYGVSISDADEAAISDAAEGLIDANSRKALKALGANEETVGEYLRLCTIQSRMRDAIDAEADVDVTDEEAKTGDYSYVRVATDSKTDDEGNSVEYTDEEKADLREAMEAVAKDAAGGSLEDAAESAGYTVESGTFTESDESIDEAVLKELSGLSEGDVSGVVEAEDAYYVLRLDAEKDEEATAETKEQMIQDAKDEHYDEVLEGFKESHEWSVNEEAWGEVTFDNLFTTVQETEESGTEEAVTEAADTQG